MTIVRLIVSGKTYFECLDPLCTGVPEEIGLLPYDRAAKSIRRGRGYQIDYGLIPLDMAEDVLDHLDTMGYLRTNGIDPDDYESRAAGRAIIKDHARLAAAIKEAGINPQQ